jgi:nitrate/nitrite-specific signal transduction histidine kinase
MTERVKSLRGSCVIDGARDKGSTIRIEIPVQREKTERARALELVGGMS